MLKYKYNIFSNRPKIYGSNFFIKQPSETVTVLNHQNADCSLREKFIVSFFVIFGRLSFPRRQSAVVQVYYTCILRLRQFVMFLSVADQAETRRLKSRLCDFRDDGR